MYETWLRHPLQKSVQAAKERLHVSMSRLPDQVLDFFLTQEIFFYSGFRSCQYKIIVAMVAKETMLNRMANANARCSGFCCK